MLCSLIQFKKTSKLFESIARLFPELSFPDIIVAPESTVYKNSVVIGETEKTPSRLLI